MGMARRITERLGCRLPLYLEREIDASRAERLPPIEICLRTLAEGVRRFCAEFRDFPAFCSM